MTGEELGTERQISPVTAHGTGHRDDYVISVNDRPILKDLTLERVHRILAEYYLRQSANGLIDESERECLA